MKYVDTKQVWTEDKDSFWGGMEGAEKFIEKLVSDDSLEWKADDHLQYISARLSNKMVVNITLRGRFYPTCEFWIVSLEGSSPPVKLVPDTIEEDLSGKATEPHRAILASKLEKFKNEIEEYVKG